MEAAAPSSRPSSHGGQPPGRTRPRDFHSRVRLPSAARSWTAWRGSSAACALKSSSAPSRVSPTRRQPPRSRMSARYRSHGARQGPRAARGRMACGTIPAVPEPVRRLPLCLLRSLRPLRLGRARRRLRLVDRCMRGDGQGGCGRLGCRWHVGRLVMSTALTLRVCVQVRRAFLPWPALQPPDTVAASLKHGGLEPSRWRG
mmetsp:Transcript_4800/g.20561  ORF Transcript_4800/g.20561 Transcript_4800/m.20561 type:complete len:201 (+) Transcript_4800:1797-2399(+)